MVVVRPTCEVCGAPAPGADGRVAVAPLTGPDWRAARAMTPATTATQPTMPIARRPTLRRPTFRMAFFAVLASLARSSADSSRTRAPRTKSSSKPADDQGSSVFATCCRLRRKEFRRPAMPRRNGRHLDNRLSRVRMLLERGSASGTTGTRRAVDGPKIRWEKP